MIHVSIWLELLFLILILRQSAAASDQCSELQSKISRLENALHAATTQVHLTDQTCISQNASSELQKTEALLNDLKKELEAKEETIKNNCEKQVQLQTAINSLTKTVESLNQAAALLYQEQEKLENNVDDLMKTVDSLNQTSRVLCGTPECACRALLDAVKSGDLERTKRWVTCDSSDKCTDNDENRNTPLTYAASKGDLEVVRVLLEGGANVDRADAQQRTGLHLAAWNGHLEVCRLLLDRGAKVNSLDKWKSTPLHNAAWKGRLSIVKLLVERRADLSLKDKNGVTPIDAARGYKDVFEWLNSVSHVKRR